MKAHNKKYFTYYRETRRTIFGNPEGHFFLKRNNVGKNLFFTFNWKKSKNYVAWLNTEFQPESLRYEKLRLSWKKYSRMNIRINDCLFYSIISG